MGKGRTNHWIRRGVRCSTRSITEKAANARTGRERCTRAWVRTNLLGTGCLAAALAVQKWLKASRKQGTIRYYGCPAEEGGSGKVFLACSGEFDGLDAVLNFHPGTINHANKGSNVGVNHIRFRFFGRASHAGGSPHLGRSGILFCFLFFLRSNSQPGKRPGSSQLDLPDSCILFQILQRFNGKAASNETKRLTAFNQYLFFTL